MGSGDISIGTLENTNLRSEVSHAVGKTIRFSNGCWLDLRDDSGTFWGSTPYGLDWACNADSNWLPAVLSWLSYWDQPRDESGNLMVFD